MIMLSKKVMNFLKCFLLVFGLIACSQKDQVPSQDIQHPPNIILILADDLGFGDLGCYGQETLTTPNIDRLAEQGIKFFNHYTGSTVCAPSRASLLTGLHTGHVSVRGNYAGQLLTEEVTLATLLKQVGYKTSLIGKWGVGHPPEPDDPKRNGFDDAYGYINMWHAHNFYPEFLYRNGQVDSIPENQLARNEDGSRKWAEDKPEGTGVAEIRGKHTHELFEAEALKYIEDNTDHRFFLYLAFNMPHANNEHPTNGMEVPDYGEYGHQDWPEPEKGFASMIRMIDETVGRIDHKLQASGLSEHTIIIFASDNGPHQEGFHDMEFFNSNSELRGMKRDLYDGGVKTPLIIKWPNHIAPGTTTEHVSAFWDILPTLAEIAGGKSPEGIDGISFLPTLLGNHRKQQKHDYLYWEFYEQGGRQALLKNNLKVVRQNVRTGDAKATELYDIESDPSESIDLAAEKAGQLRELEALMEQAHKPLSSMSLFEIKPDESDGLSGK